MEISNTSNRSASAKRRWNRYHGEIVEKAHESFEYLADNPLFAAGISCYWGKGDSKIGNPLRLSNTDPRMIALYTTFLRDIMGVLQEKIKIGLILYPDLFEAECKSFWGIITNLPAQNFIKTQFIQGRHPTKRLAHGVCMVIVSSRAAKLTMLTWIDFFAKRYTMNP